MDKAQQRRLARRMDCFLQISLSGLTLRVDSFEESSRHRLASCVDLKVKDFFIAETISSTKPTKLLGEWFNDKEHPRDTKQGLIMLRMVTWHPKTRVTADNKIANDEGEAVLQFLPLRCHLDQRALRFIRAFFTSGEEPTAKLWASNLIEIPPPIFHAFRAKACKLKVNYTPEKVDVNALRDGSVVELVNLSPLNDMVITLQSVTMDGKVGFGEVLSDMVSHWIRDICSTQLHKFLTNSSAVQPFTSISTGAVDMVVLPWNALKNGERVGAAMQRGVGTFADAIVYEALNVTAKLTSVTANRLSRLVSPQQQAHPQQQYQQHTQSSAPSRPQYLPRGILDTTGHAFESIARGLETANYKVIIIPYREYRRAGAGSAVRSVVRGIPVAVLAPIGGASEAISYTLLGARNQVRPDIRKEEEASQKGLSRDF
jgi:autophagy-related protein 2